MDEAGRSGAERVQREQIAGPIQGNETETGIDLGLLDVTEAGAESI
jgi:hypothetical protein